MTRTPEQVARLALAAGRDMATVRRVRALLDGREFIPAAEIADALAGRQTTTEDETNAETEGLGSAR